MVATTNPQQAEDAVRRYLLAQESPELLVDRQVVATCEQRLAAASDPIERLLAFSALEAAQRVDLAAVRSAFIEHAAAFAAAARIPASAFLAYGVSRADLRDAGLLVGRGSQGRRLGSRAPRPAGTRRPASESLAAVRAALPDDVVTASEIAERSGVSVQAARDALGRLVADGVVVLVDAPVGRRHQGRAPKHYMRAPSTTAMSVSG